MGTFRSSRALAGWSAVISVLATAPALADDRGRPDLLPDCAYGSSAPGLRTFESRVQRDAWTYADRLRTGSTAQRLAAARTYAAAEVAYVYGFPLVEVHDTVRLFHVRNTIISVAALTTPETHRVVSPNVDTAYTVGWFSLAQGPLVIDVPDTGGRFYTFQLMDGWSNSFAYLGSGATGTKAGSYLLVPPGWDGEVPAGVTAVRSPTRTVWLLGRTLVDDAADLERVRPILERYTATPLPLWTAGGRSPSIVFDQQPPEQTKPPTPTGAHFVATLNRQLTLDPPPADQACVLKALAPAGVQEPDPSPAAVQAADVADLLANPSRLTTRHDPAVEGGTAAGVRLVADAGRAYQAAASAGRRGWSVMADPWIGRFGRQYLGRAVIATELLGANVPRIATYPTSHADGAGRALSGRYRYTITFPKGQLPPVRAFWSLTMYRSDSFLYDNEIDRYAVGDRSRGLRRGKDGSLTIYVQHAPPSDPAARANWLPAPPDAFHLILRMYLPQRPALDGSYRIPPFVRTR